MYKYKIIISWSEEDNCYITEVPELPYCFADGKNYEEAIKNTIEVIDLMIETAKINNIAIPEPANQIAEQVAKAS